MNEEENFFSRTIRWVKNGFLFGFALGIFPLLFPFLLVYLLFRVIYGFATGVFTLGGSIFLRVIFPPLLIYDTWCLLTGRKQ